MLRVAFCDTNKNTMSRYRSLLETAVKDTGEDICFVCFDSSERLLYDLSGDPNSADIIYLDIKANGVNGIGTACRLREIGSSSVIIFLTADRERVFEAFEANPFYYIVKKDISEKSFTDIFFKAVDAAKKNNERFLVIPYAGTVTKLSYEEIRYFEVANRRVTAHTDSSTYIFYSSLDEVENTLHSRNFLRIHRSYLVNCRYLRRLARTEATLVDGGVLPVSTKYYAKVRRTFQEYHG